MKPYPLKFTPIFKERLWGGNRLKSELGKNCPPGQIGESWEISGVEGDVSIIAKGPLEGKSLNDVLRGNPEVWLGKEVVAHYGTEFPILIKFIDAASDLSIQVHPDDKLAKERHDSFGKNEMWYIMDAEENARLILGFNQKIDRDTYLESLSKNALTDILTSQNVGSGDAFYIHAGMIHAIGGGIMLAEIQQTSDVTYRLYDYNRVDANGDKRELHTEQALEAIDFNAVKPEALSYEKEVNKANLIVNTPYFTTAFVPVRTKMKLFTKARNSFTILMGISGQLEISTSLGDEVISKGETVLIPAAAEKVFLKSYEGEVLDISL